MRKCAFCLFLGILLIGLASSSGYPNEVHYIYDPLNRLIGAKYPDGTLIQYTYDELGNRTARNVFVATASNPVADFTADPPTGVAPVTVSFTDRSAGTVVYWSWSFGDGEGSTSQNPSHTYNEIGTYSVTLTVSDGITSSSQSKTITVIHSKSVADFIASPTSGAPPLTVSFTDTSGGGNTGWLWEFGDGGTSTDQNPIHTYSNPGIYSVTFRTSEPGGISDPRTITVVAYDPLIHPPVANFSVFPMLGLVPFAAEFVDTTTGNVIGWHWDFGDGTTSTDRNPSHTYATAGIYTVSLTATGPGGSDTYTRADCIVVATPPVPGIDQYTKILLHGDGADGGTTIADSSTYAHAPSSVSQASTSTAHRKFGTASLSFNSVGSIRYPSSTDWQFRGGRDFTIDAWVYSLDNKGGGICGNLVPRDLTQWAFAVSDGYLKFFVGGNWNIVSAVPVPANQWVHVAAVRYQGRISLYINGVQTGNTSTTSISESSTPSLSISDIFASFSDSSWAFHGYIDEFRLSNGIARWTENFTPPSSPYGTSVPSAAFTASVGEGTAPLAVQFTDTSGGTVTEWLWDFGDGTTSTIPNPNHLYSAPGTYTVSLTVTGPNGSDTRIRADCIIVIEEPPPVPGIDQYTKILLHGDGADGGTTIADSSTYAHAPSSVSQASTSTAHRKFGTASLSFNSVGSIRYPSSTDWQFRGGRDFTIDAWVYSLDNKGGGICGNLVPRDLTQWAFAVSDGYLKFFVGGNWNIVSAVPVPANQWVHVAAVRYQGRISLYINGVQTGNTSTTSISESSTPSLSISDIFASFSDSSWAFHGYIDEFRLSNGIARWTENFAPPDAPYGH